MYDPRQLQILAEVARTGTFTAAAKALGYTQPAVSYQMRMLERAVGTPLVTRRGRGVHFTPAGHALARHANAVLAALRTAEEEVSALTAPGSGRIRVAAMQSSCVTLVPQALGALRRSHPELQVTVTQAECHASHRLLLNGEVDLAVLCDADAPSLNGAPTGTPAAAPSRPGSLPAQPARGKRISEPGPHSLPEPRPEPEPVSIDPRLRRIPLLTDRRCILLPADHPAAARVSVPLAGLAKERWVLESGRTRFLAACHDAGFTPRVAATVDDQLTLHHMVAHGIGLAVVNELALTAHTDPRVVARPLAGWPVRRVFALLWPDTLGIPAASALLQALTGTALRQNRLDSCTPSPGLSGGI
ncbi:LysR family transcriptional regulator [Streptomyces chartreusis]|uniref:LysR family transcriptional regulator n=1 Tax=Streptomyces chartreusis TaxID=1969 RepID=UPI003818B4AC